MLMLLSPSVMPSIPFSFSYDYDHETMMILSIKTLTICLSNDVLFIQETPEAQTASFLFLTGPRPNNLIRFGLFVGCLIAPGPLMKTTFQTTKNLWILFIY